jgi:hypothetical protein
MGIVREPKGVDLIVGPSKLTKEDLKIISDTIAAFKKTGKIPRIKKRTVKRKRKAHSA